MAQKKGAHYLALLGANEINNRKITIKNLKEHKQTELSLDDKESVYNFLREGLNE